MTKATFNLRIDAELKTKFSQKLKERNETATSVVVKAIEAYCNDSNAVTPVSNDSNDVTPDSKGGNAVTPVSNDSPNVTLDSNGSNDPSSRAQERHGIGTVHSWEVAELRRDVDRLKHTERWSDRYFSDLQSQVYSVKSQVLTLESSVEPRLEQYLMENPDMEINSLWDAIDYVGLKIDNLSISPDNPDSTIEVIHNHSDMSREKETTPSEIPLESTKEKIEDDSSESSQEAPDEPHKEVSENNLDQMESSIDIDNTEESSIDSEEEGWLPMEQLADHLGIIHVSNLKNNVSKKFGRGGTYTTYTTRKGEIEVKRELQQNGRTKNRSMKGRLIKGVR